MDKETIEGLIYEKMYSFKYMLENHYTFNDYVNTVAVMASKELENKINKKDEKSY
jgi:hypothetical protein